MTGLGEANWACRLGHGPCNLILFIPSFYVIKIWEFLSVFTVTSILTWKPVVFFFSRRGHELYKYGVDQVFFKRDPVPCHRVQT